MKKLIKVSAMRLGLITFAVGFMTMFSGCYQEELLTQDAQLDSMVNFSKAKASGPSANGQGIHTRIINPLGETVSVHLSFHAKEKKDGSVQGSAVYSWAGTVVNSKLDIDCIRVEGNMAVMSGLITRDNEDPAYEGLLFGIVVVDNGEGANADADLIGVFFGTNPDIYQCNFDVSGLFLRPVEKGNIQVRE